jgi:hypothetical protein
MTKSESERRSIHWAMKVLLAMLVAGPFVIGAFFFPANPFPNVLPKGWFGPLYVGLIFLAATACATFLYLGEGNGWRRSVLMGVVIGLSGAAITMGIGFLYVLWLMSNIRFV